MQIVIKIVWCVDIQIQTAAWVDRRLRDAPPVRV